MITQYTGLEYLKIDIASNFSSKLEKCNFEDRIQWFNENEPKLNNIALIKEASNPNLYQAGVNAYQKYLKKESSGYLISLDATSSGLQLLSALVSCKQSMSICGLIGANRVDAYITLYKKIDPSQRYTRDQVKQTIMTTYYNSEAQPKLLFGKGEMLNKFYDVLHKYTPGAFKLNDLIGSIWDKKKLSNNYVMPDNFHVIIPVIQKDKISFNYLDTKYEIIKEVNKCSENYRSLSPNVIHSCDSYVVREIQRRTNYNLTQIITISELINTNSGNQSYTRDKDIMLMTLWDHYLRTNMLSLRIIDYIDQYNIGNINTILLANLINTLPTRSYQMLTVHDNFRSLPNYGNDTRQQYNNIMNEITQSNLLQDIFRQLTGDLSIKINKIDKIENEILNAEYALS
jgi:hypothetical protein